MSITVKAKVTLSIENSPRGSFQKMLVVRTPMNYMTSTAFIRPEGANGLVMHYQGSGMRYKIEFQYQRKRFEFDEGLVFFPLTRNVSGIRVDAEIHGPNLVIKNLPNEIMPRINYPQVPAPAVIPRTGTPVRIMKEFNVTCAQTISGGTKSLGLNIGPHIFKLFNFERFSIKRYGDHGLQYVRDPEGIRVSTLQNFGMKRPSYGFRCAYGSVPVQLHRVPVKYVKIVAKWDEASESVICEDILLKLQEAVDIKRRTMVEEPTPVAVKPNGKTNGLLNPIEHAMDLLRKHVSNGEYDAGWSDGLVAKHTHLKAELIQSIREAGFKKAVDPKAAAIANINEKLAALMAEMKALTT